MRETGSETYSEVKQICELVNKQVTNIKRPLAKADYNQIRVELQGILATALNITRLGQLGANISPDRSSLTPQVLIGNFLFNPFVVCHKYWEKLYELQHINLLSLYLPKEDGVSPDVKYITQQIIFSIFLQ